MVLVEKQIQKKPKTDKVIAIDLGLKDFVVIVDT